MRWRLVFGFGVAGVVTGSALGQFAVDRVPPTPQTPPNVPASIPQNQPVSVVPPGFQPVSTAGPGAYTPPVGGVMPAGGVPGAYPTLASVTSPQSPSGISAPPKMELVSCLGPDHPWALKPEHGAFFICVKSYSRPHTPTPEDNGPSARVLAEALAKQIREIHHQQAFLYEYISEERKAEAAALAAERERGRIFAEQLKTRQQQSELQGMTFLEADNKIRFKTVNYRDQIAVLIGGFQSDEAARKALDFVHAWPAPKDSILMDGAVIAKPVTDKNAYVEKCYINPYGAAYVVPNPLAPKQAQASAPLDPFIVKLNEGHPYNLLKAKKEWTIGVKVFNAPIEIVSKETDPNLMRNKESTKKAANALLAGAVQAEQMAKMLREMKDKDGRSLGLEAFVLHTRNSSVVTVGQFDGPNDPAMAQTKNLLNNMKLKVTEDKDGVKPVDNAPVLFEKYLVAMPIPKP